MAFVPFSADDESLRILPFSRDEINHVNFLKHHTVGLTVAAAATALQSTPKSVITAPNGRIRVSHALPLLAGRYKVVYELGRGAFSSLLCARDCMKAGEPHVAVKVMNESNSQIGLQEYEMLQDLVPNRPSDDIRLVRCLDKFQFFSHFCIVFELLGRSLGSELGLDDAVSAGVAVSPQPNLVAPRANYANNTAMPGDSSISRPFKPSPPTTPVNDPAGIAGVSFSAPMPIRQLRQVALDLVSALAFMHHRGYIHADVKPSNILVDTPTPQKHRPHAAPDTTSSSSSYMSRGHSHHHGSPHPPHHQHHRSKRSNHPAVHPSGRDAGAVFGRDVPGQTQQRVKLADVGNSFPVWAAEMYMEAYELQTPDYRAPEVYMGLPFGTAIDMWSVGLVLMEARTGTRVVDSQGDANRALHQIRALCGPLPDAVFGRGKFSAQYSALLHPSSPLPPSRATRGATRTRRNGGGGSNQADLVEGSGAVGAPVTSLEVQTVLMGQLQTRNTACVDFIRRLLAPDPAQRMSACEALLHPFLAPLSQLTAVLPPAVTQNVLRTGGRYATSCAGASAAEFRRAARQGRTASVLPSRAEPILPIPPAYTPVPPSPAASRARGGRHGVSNATGTVGLRKPGSGGVVSEGPMFGRSDQPAPSLQELSRWYRRQHEAQRASRGARGGTGDGGAGDGGTNSDEGAGTSGVGRQRRRRGGRDNKNLLDMLQSQLQDGGSDVSSSPARRAFTTSSSRGLGVGRDEPKPTKEDGLSGMGQLSALSVIAALSPSRRQLSMSSLAALSPASTPVLARASSSGSAPPASPRSGLLSIPGVVGEGSKTPSSQRKQKRNSRSATTRDKTLPFVGSLGSIGTPSPSRRSKTTSKSKMSSEGLAGRQAKSNGGLKASAAMDIDCSPSSSSSPPDLSDEQPPSSRNTKRPRRNAMAQSATRTADGRRRGRGEAANAGRVTATVSLSSDSSDSGDADVADSANGPATRTRRKTATRSPYARRVSSLTSLADLGQLRPGGADGLNGTAGLGRAGKGVVGVTVLSDAESGGTDFDSDSTFEQ